MVSMGETRASVSGRVLAGNRHNTPNELKGLIEESAMQGIFADVQEGFTDSQRDGPVPRGLDQ